MKLQVPVVKIHLNRKWLNVLELAFIDQDRNGRKRILLLRYILIKNNQSIISLFIIRCLFIPYRSLYLASVRISGYIISPAIGHVVTIIPLWCVMIIVITQLAYQRCFKIEMNCENVYFLLWRWFIVGLYCWIYDENLFTSK